MKEKFRKHKGITRAVAVILAVAMVATSYLFVISGSSATFDYIETLREQYSQDGESFDVLEIVPQKDRGTFGYYVGGYEADWTGGLSSLSGKTARQNYVNNTLFGYQDLFGASTSETSPLKRGTYAESYPWNKDATHTNTVYLDSYEKIPETVTGSATENEVSGAYISSYEMGYSSAGGDYDLNADKYTEESLITNQIRIDSKKYSVSDPAHWQEMSDGTYYRKWYGMDVTYDPATDIFTYNGSLSADTKTVPGDKNFLAFTIKNPEGYTYRATYQLVGGKYVGSSGSKMQAVCRYNNAFGGLDYNNKNATVCELSAATLNFRVGMYNGNWSTVSYVPTVDHLQYKIKLEKVQDDNILTDRIDWDSEFYSSSDTKHWKNNYDGTYTFSINGYTVVYTAKTSNFTVNGQAVDGMGVGGSNYFPDLSFRYSSETENEGVHYSSVINQVKDSAAVARLDLAVPIFNTVAVYENTKADNILYNYSKEKESYIPLTAQIYANNKWTQADPAKFVNYQVTVRVCRDCDEIFKTVLKDSLTANATRWVATDGKKNKFTLTLTGDTADQYVATYDAFNRTMSFQGKISGTHTAADLNFLSLVISNTDSSVYHYYLKGTEGNIGTTDMLQSPSLKTTGYWRGMSGYAAGSWVSTNDCPVDYNSGARDISSTKPAHQYAINLKNFGFRLRRWVSTSTTTFQSTGKNTAVLYLRKDVGASTYDNLVEKAIKSDAVWIGDVAAANSPKGSWVRQPNGTYTKTLDGVSITYYPLTNEFVYNGVQAVNTSTYYTDEADAYYDLPSLLSLNGVAKGDYELALEYVKGSFSSDTELSPANPGDYEMQPVFYMDGGSFANGKNSTRSYGIYQNINEKALNDSGSVRLVNAANAFNVNMRLYYYIPRTGAGVMRYNNYTFKASLHGQSYSGVTTDEYYASLSFEPLVAYQDLPDGKQIYVYEKGKYVYYGTIGDGSTELDVSGQFYGIKQVKGVSSSWSPETPYVITVTGMDNNRYVARSDSTPGAFSKTKTNNLRYVGAGKGDTDFEAGSGDTFNMTTNVIYCNNPFTNNELFKKEVFEDSNADMNVTVTSLTPEELESQPNYPLAVDMIVISAGLEFLTATPAIYQTVTYQTDITQEVADNILAASREYKTPIIVDTAVQTNNCPVLEKTMKELGKNGLELTGAASNSGGDNLYYNISVANDSFAVNGTYKVPANKSEITKQIPVWVELIEGNTYTISFTSTNLLTQLFLFKDGSSDCRACISNRHYANGHRVYNSSDGTYTYTQTFTVGQRKDSLGNDLIDTTWQNYTGSAGGNYQIRLDQDFSAGSSGSYSVTDITVKSETSKYGGVTDNVYFFSTGCNTGAYNMATQTFAWTLDKPAAEPYYQEVLDQIETENNIRRLKGTAGVEVIDPHISICNAIRAVINFAYKRVENKKESIRVLDLEPYVGLEGASGCLTESMVRSWLPEETKNTLKTVTINTMAIAEFDGNMDNIVEDYDLVYIGTSTTNMNTKTVGGKEVPNYNDDTMDGMYYTNIGDVYHVMSSYSRVGHMTHPVLGGMIAEELYVKKEVGSGGKLEVRPSDDTAYGLSEDETYTVNGKTYGSGKKTTYTMQTRSSGNDLTLKKYRELVEAVDSQIPVILSDDFLYEGNQAATLSFSSKINSESWLTDSQSVELTLNGKENLPSDVTVIYTWYYSKNVDAMTKAAKQNVGSATSSYDTKLDCKDIESDTWFYCDVTLNSKGKYRNMDSIHVKSPVFHKYQGVMYELKEVGYNGNDNNYISIKRYSPTLSPLNGDSLVPLYVDDSAAGHGLYNNTNNESLWGNYNLYKGDQWGFSWYTANVHKLKDTGFTQKYVYTQYYYNTDAVVCVIKYCGASLTVLGSGSTRGGASKDKFRGEDIKDYPKEKQTFDGYAVSMPINYNAHGKAVTIAAQDISFKESTLDNSSNMYKFMNEKYISWGCTGSGNILAAKQASKDAQSKERVNSYLNLSSPELKLYKADEETVLYDETESDYNALPLGDPDASGKRYPTLSFDFYIKNNTDLTPSRTKYNFEFYLDENADGIYAESELQDSYVLTTKVAGKDVEVKSGELRGCEIAATEESKSGFRADFTYHFTMALDSYGGGAPWKMVVTKVGQENAHHSYEGISYVEPTKEEFLHVLQILPQSQGTSYQDRLNSEANSNYGSDSYEAEGSVFMGEAYADGKIEGITQYTAANYSTKAKSALMQACIEKEQVFSNGKTNLADNEVLLNVRDQFLMQVDVMNMAEFENEINAAAEAVSTMICDDTINYNNTTGKLGGNTLSTLSKEIEVNKFYSGQLDETSFTLQYSKYDEEGNIYFGNLYYYNDDAGDDTGENYLVIKRTNGKTVIYLKQGGSIITKSACKIYEQSADYNWMTQDFFDYDMLIIGFGEKYYKNVGEDAAWWIGSYIENTQKPVLYSHDATSYFNSYMRSGKEDSYSTHSGDIQDEEGYYLNKHVRFRVGLDRYGAANVMEDLFYDRNERSGNGTPDGYTGTKTKDFKKKYSGIYYNNTDTTFGNSYYFEKNSIETEFWRRTKSVTVNNKGKDYSATAMENMGYAVAYKPGSARGITMAGFVHGFTRHTMTRFNMLWISGDGWGDLPADQLLPTKNGVYHPDMTNDGTYKTATLVSVSVNGFYKPLNKNVNKTTEVTQVNKGQITSYPFDLNTAEFGGSSSKTKLTIKPTYEQYYQLNVNSDETCCWYCLGGTEYEGTASAPDVRNDCINCYYLYSIGNVKYTGAGHLNKFSTDEAKLFANILIASFQQVAAAPVPKFVSENNSEKAQTHLLLTETQLNGLADTNIYFRIETTTSGRFEPYVTAKLYIQARNQDGSYVTDASGNPVYIVLCDEANTITVYYTDNGVEKSTPSNKLLYNKTYYLKAKDVKLVNSAGTTSVDESNYTLMDYMNGKGLVGGTREVGLTDVKLMMEGIGYETAIRGGGRSVSKQAGELTLSRLTNLNLN